MRAEFDEEVSQRNAELMRPPLVGDFVLTHGEQAELLSFSESGGCMLRI